MSLLLALAMQVAAQPAHPRPKVTQADLNGMADSCHAPREWLTLKGEEVIFGASPDAKFATIKCVLRKVTAVVAMSNIAFIGNEQVSEKK